MPFDNMWTVGLTAVFFVTAILIQRHNRAQRRAELEEELGRLGLELVDARIWTSGGKHSRTENFEFEARRPGDPLTYNAAGRFHMGAPVYAWSGVNPLLADQEARLLERDRLEAQELTVDQEVAMRLDAITATPGAMLEHDLDGSGHIDSAEWDALRAKVRAEVEAARAARASGDDAPAEDSHAEPEDDAPSGAAW